MKILKIYTQNMPALRFIGKKYGEADRVNGSFGQKWGEAFNTGLFDIIDNAKKDSPISFEDSDAYIGLMRGNEKYFEYWIGEFASPDIAVPEGFEFIDFDKHRLGVGWVYGNEQSGELYCHEDAVSDLLEKDGERILLDEDGAMCVFERYACPRFTTPDEAGNVILDICFMIRERDRS